MNISQRSNDSDPVPKLVKFTNCQVLECNSTHGRDLLFHGEVIIDREKGIIAEIINKNEESQTVNHLEHHDMDIVDCKGHILAPGFIDIQMNGAFGIDFSVDKSINHSSIEEVSQKLLSHGVTSFCPTLISCEPSTYQQILPKFAKYITKSKQINKTQARILGLHLEGPFFEPSKRGAHPESCILDHIDGIIAMKEIYGEKILHDLIEVQPGLFGLVRIITMAPELPGALDVIRDVTKYRGTPRTTTNSSSHLDKRLKQNSNQIIISCGHTNATMNQGLEAIHNGASLITHLFNAMRPFHHREPGLLGLLTKNNLQNESGTSSDNEMSRPYYSIIADGIHVHPSAVNMAHSLHPEGTILVTDAMSAMGLGDGIHSLGQHMKVRIEGKRATIVGSDTLAGSAVSMDSCVRSFYEFTKCSIGEALLAATVRPSELLKWDFGGKIRKGCVADLILLDNDLNVMQCWVAGKKVDEKC